MNRQYIGARYVPKFAEPIEWDNLRSYEALTIVTYAGTSYTSKKPVPVGINLDNSEYWVATGNYNAQIEDYRNETKKLNDKVNKLVASIIDYGGVGDGVTDNTSALNEALLNNDTVYFPRGTYLINFSALDLTNKTLFGDNRNDSVIKANSGNKPFARIGNNTIIHDLGFITSNTLETELFVCGTYEGKFVKYNNCHLYNLMLNLDYNTTGILSYAKDDGSGSGTFENIYINKCKNGFVDKIEQIAGFPYITAETVKNVFIYDPYNYGYAQMFSRTGKGTFNFAQNKYVGITVEIINGTSNACGFKLNIGGYVVDTPYVFNDNPTGVAYGLELEHTYDSKLFKSIINGGQIEGAFNSEANNKYFNFVNSNLIIRNSYSDRENQKNVTYNSYDNNVVEAINKESVALSPLNYIDMNNDLNDFIFSGSYYSPSSKVSSSLTNTPTTVSFTMNCYRLDGQFTLQKVRECLPPYNEYIRRYANNTWTEWSTISTNIGNLKWEHSGKLSANDSVNIDVEGKGCYLIATLYDGGTKHSALTFVSMCSFTSALGGNVISKIVADDALTVTTPSIGTINIHSTTNIEYSVIRIL